MDESFINHGTSLVTFGNRDLTNYSSNVKRHELPKYWERDYINQCINTVTNHEHRMLLQFLWMTGVRITEAISILKRDLDFQNYMINVRWLKNKKYLYRNIPMHPRLRDILQLYTVHLKADDKVFPISRQRAWQIVQRDLKGHPHQFRHSFAVNWLRSGGDFVILSRMLGHSKIETTMEYLKIVPIDQGKELLKIQF